MPRIILDFSLGVVANKENTRLRAMMRMPSMIRTFDAFNRDLTELNDCGMFHGCAFTTYISS